MDQNCHALANALYDCMTFTVTQIYRWHSWSELEPGPSCTSYVLQSIRVHDNLHKFIDDTVIRSGGEDRHAPADALQPLQVPHGALRSLPHRSVLLPTISCIAAGFFNMYIFAMAELFLKKAEKKFGTAKFSKIKERKRMHRFFQTCLRVQN